MLPYTNNKKLKFSLCRTCAENETQTPCICSDSKRSFTGTWCTPEIIKDVEKGYIIQKKYEVWHWEKTTQYDPETKTGGLFAPYIDMFLKIKQEASGWPKDCTSEKKKKIILSHIIPERVFSLMHRTFKKTWLTFNVKIISKFFVGKICSKGKYDKKQIFSWR